MGLDEMEHLLNRQPTNYLKRKPANAPTIITMNESLFFKTQFFIMYKI